MEWLKAFNANIGFNSLKDTVQVLGATYLAPGYNYGLSVSLGQLFTTGPRIDMAKEMQKVEELERDQSKLNLRKEVLHRYNEHLLSIEILKTRQLAEEDASATFQLISALFKKNRANFDEKNKASITYYDTMEKRLAAETEVSNTKYSLEEILGVKWEQVERLKVRYGR